MKNTNEQMRLMVSFLCLLILLSTAFSMALMAQAEPITPEDYDGLVILEDPALLVGVAVGVVDARINVHGVRAT